MLREVILAEVVRQEDVEASGDDTDTGEEDADVNEDDADVGEEDSEVDEEDANADEEYPDSAHRPQAQVAPDNLPIMPGTPSAHRALAMPVVRPGRVHAYLTCDIGIVLTEIVFVSYQLTLPEQASPPRFHRLSR